MEQLVMAIAIPLAKQYGMNKALEIAYEKLGIAAPENTTEIDILTGGGINQAFSPGNLANMAKRGALNLGIKSLGSKGVGALGALGPFALIGGLAFLGNKYRKQLTGYDTQQAYEDAKTERIANKRLDKITDRIVDGKNYGNYEEALLDSGAGAVEIDGTIYSGPDYQGDDNNNNGGNGGGSKGGGSKGGGHSGSGYQGASGSHHYRRGGIASL